MSSYMIRALPPGLISRAKAVDYWKLAIMPLLLVWILPGRYTLETRESFKFDLDEVFASGQSNTLRNMLTINNGTTVVSRPEESEHEYRDRLQWCHDRDKRCAQEPARYFRHSAVRWYWPWWTETPYPIYYTHPITIEEAFAHGHLAKTKLK